MLAYVDLVTALAGEQTGLFLHAAVVGFELALAVAEVGTAPHTNNGEARPSRDVLLLGVVLVAVLQAAQFQITTHLGGDAFTADLAARKAGVTIARLNVGGGFPNHRAIGVVPQLDATFATIDRVATEAFGADRPVLAMARGAATVEMVRGNFRIADAPTGTMAPARFELAGETVTLSDADGPAAELALAL